jgi:hypothetical protein
MRWLCDGDDTIGVTTTCDNVSGESLCNTRSIRFTFTYNSVMRARVHVVSRVAEAQPIRNRIHVKEAIGSTLVHKNGHSCVLVSRAMR